LNDVAGGEERVCRVCGFPSSGGAFCVRCGTALTAAARTQFAAAPHEHRLLPSLAGLVPQLPREDVAAFRLALALGGVILAVLVVSGLYPLAIVGAAAILPLLVVLYLYDVDLYENEPLPIIGLTMATGLAAGLLVGYLSRLTAPSGAGALVESTGARLVRDGVAWPVVGTMLMLVGPLVLLRSPRFNDVLDGTTFGAASAVSFEAGALLTGSGNLLQSGLRPTGRATPWLAEIATGGIVLPLLAASVVGAACGALWLTFRTPIDSGRLGWLGRPAVAVPLALAALVAAAAAQVILGPWWALFVCALLAVGGLVWLRHPIQVGLLQEAAELDVTGEVVCANCGARGPRHSFCANCGVSLRALPKAHPGGARPRLSTR
jgi:hypothetical protein